MNSKGLAAIHQSIRTIADFPKKGILFRDITPLLADGNLFRRSVDHFARLVRGKIDTVISIESRGFILGSSLAYRLGSGFVPVRKAGKLPHRTFSSSYDLEYGKAEVEIHRDALKRGGRVLLVDDVLATGGTMRAAIQLVDRFKVRIAGVYFLIELDALKGRQQLRGLPVHSLVRY